MTESTTTTKRPHRANGDGSVTTRSDGALIVRAHVNGKRRAKILPRVANESKTAKNKRVAAAVAALRAEHDRPDAVIKADKTTLGAYFHGDYLPSIVAAGRGPVTVKGYTDQFNLYVAPVLGDVPLAQITVDQIDRLLRDLAATKSTGTCRLVSGLIGRVLHRATAKGLLEKNPAQYADRPAADKRDVTHGAIEPVEALAIIAAAAGSDFELPIALLALTGMRRGEVLGLRRRDITIRDGVATLNVSKNLVPVGAKLHYGDPKTNGSKRTLTVTNKRLVAMLSAHLLTVGDRTVTISDKPVDLVFIDPIGRPMSPSVLSAAVVRYAKRAGITRPVGPHRFRHGAASTMIESGTPISQVSAALGHANPNITLTTYTHAFDRQNVASMSVLDAAVGWE